MTAGAMLFAQGGDAATVMADMRKALGGEQKLAAVKALSAAGKSQRSQGETSFGGEYELMLELPDKFFSRQVMAQTPMGAIAGKTGFNGNGLIQEMEQPPQMQGMRIVTGGSANPNATPEERAAAALRQVTTNKHELARMALGMFGNAVAGYSLDYTYGGVAEAPDGKADVINVKGPDDFAGKLFVDQKTHLPLMFTWMAKEPMVMSASAGRPGGPGGAQVMTFGGGGGGQSMSTEDRDKMIKDMEALRKEADANRKMVEYRMFYSDYQPVDGIQLPHTFQQAVGNSPFNEITIDKYKVNPKIDPKKFETVK
jgi:hypothetical protein